MQGPNPRRTWAALIGGIVAGYAVLAVTLWSQDDRMGALAIGLSLAAALLSLRELRRRGCRSAGAAAAPDS